jgi:hypothetical protein
MDSAWMIMGRGAHTGAFPSTPPHAQRSGGHGPGGSLEEAYPGHG